MNTFQEFSDDQQRKSWNAIISHAFEMYKGIFLYALLAMVLYTVASLVIQPISGFDSSAFAEEMRDAEGDFSSIDIWAIPGFTFYYGLSALVSLLIVPLFVGVIYMANKYDCQEPLTAGDLFIGYKQNFLNIVIYGLLSSIILAISMMMCFLPFFLVLPLLMLGYPILLFENASFGQAISKSFRIAKENYGVFLSTSLLGLLISLAGLLVCGIGIFATLPFYLVVMYSVYAAYFGTPRPLAVNN